MKEFLNPKSMLTPGVAGATMMFLVNGMSVPFPELPARYVALALSFVIGAVVFNAENLKLVERGVFWVLNSLVIFVVGFGTNNLGIEATTNSTAPRAGLIAPAGEQHSFAWPVPSVYAADDVKGAKAATPAGTAAAAKSSSPAIAVVAEAEKLRFELEALRLENVRLKQASQGTARPPTEQRPFFRKW